MNSNLKSILVTMLFSFGAITSLAVPSGKVQEQVGQQNKRGKSPLDKALLDSLMKVALVINKANPDPDLELKNRNIIGGDKTLFALSLAMYLDPELQSTDGCYVRDRVKEHLLHILSGSNEPSCRGDLFSWKEIGQAFALTFARKTPQLWDQFSPGEKEKFDWLMRAFAVAGNYQNHFDNWPKRCLYQTYSIGKNWNPNHNDGYVGIMIAAYYYFGGADVVNSFLSSFDYDVYMSNFRSFGFRNIMACWSQTGKTLFENGGKDAGGGTVKGVRMPFVMGDPLVITQAIPYEPVALYRSIGNWMYCHPAANSSKSGKAFILNGGSTPVLGQIGMCREFQVTDGFPPNVDERSDASYSYLGWFLHIPTVAAMMALGGWSEGGELADIERRMIVGSEDLIYKLEVGYRGYSKGKTSNQYDYGHNKEGYVVMTQIWYNYIKPNLSVSSTGCTAVFNELKITPTPFNDRLLIQSGAPMDHVVLYTMGGTCILREPMHGMPLFVLSTSHLPSGPYVVSIADEKGIRFNSIINKQ